MLPAVALASLIPFSQKAVGIESVWIFKNGGVCVLGRNHDPGPGREDGAIGERNGRCDEAIH